jgi:DNA-binding CsgD family transcriptional regulator
VCIAREAGALSELPLALSSRVYVHLFAGELAAAAALVAEAEGARDATGSHLAPYGALGLAAYQAGEGEPGEAIEASRTEVVSRGEGMGLSITQWASALLCNGQGRYGDALEATRHAIDHGQELGVGNWALAELIEAAALGGETDLAAAALERLAEMTQASATDWALGVEARSRALVSEGDAAERCHREAIERLGRTRVRMELARAQLLYGEWLRGRQRRMEAREHLHTAHELFGQMGAQAFAERARTELSAAGETVRSRRFDTAGDLTAQEAQIARLASDGRTNTEIGAQLFISPRTVEYHMHKVFAKLGISSRKELRAALPDTRTAVPA